MLKAPQPLGAAAWPRPTAPWRGRRRQPPTGAVPTSPPQALSWLGMGMGTRRTQPQILRWIRPWTGPSLRTHSRTLQGPALSPGPGDRPQRGQASEGRNAPPGARKVTWGSPPIIPHSPEAGGLGGQVTRGLGALACGQSLSFPQWGPKPLAAASRLLLFPPRVGDSRDSPRPAGEMATLPHLVEAACGGHCPCPHAPTH